MARLRMHTIALLTGLLVGLPPVLAAPAGGTFEAWQARRAKLAGDASLTRYYTFEDARDAATPIRNEGREAGADLRFGGAPAAEFRLVPGRWPQKKAVRLDRGSLACKPFDVPDRKFTASLWFRKLGYGALRGNGDNTTGTIISVGIGYWDGWRVTTWYPERRFLYEIGRPQGINAIAYASNGGFGDGYWSHLAATWDGQAMRLFLNGRQIAGGAYPGGYTKPAPDAVFRIGFAGFGIGSVIMDTDEVCIHNRALSPEEVLREAHWYTDLPTAAVTGFLAAETKAATGDQAGAQTDLQRVMAMTGLHPDLQATARLRLAEVLLARHDARGAVAELSRVFESEALPESHRGQALSRLLDLVRQNTVPRPVAEKILALPDIPARERFNVRLSLARSLRQEGRAAEAQAQYQQALAMPEVTAGDRLSIELELAHACYQAGNLPAAREAYGKLAAQTDAPVAWRSLAQLRLAETWLNERRWADARREYGKLAGLTGVPPHHVWEAQERTREADRVAAGQPARDPAANRVALPARPAPAVTLTVAPGGADTNPGTPDRPLASLAGARQAIRALKAKGPLPRGGVQVVLRGGTYPLRETFALEAQDSGTAEAPIVYRSAPGETARLHGGAVLKGLAPVTDAAVLARLPEAARAKVRQVDLKAAGITDYGKLILRGVGAGTGPWVDLYWNGRPCTLARWPNEGFARAEAITAGGAGGQPFAFRYAGDRPARWTQADDAWLYGFWRWDWADTRVRVTGIDPAKREIKIDNAAGYGAAGTPRWWAFNLLEELDSPGEWYVDRKAGVLYVWPPSDPAGATVELPLLNNVMISGEKLAQVTFERLTLDCGRSGGLRLTDAEGCLVAGCTVQRFGENGVMVLGGHRVGLFGCDIHTLGRRGTEVIGGDRKTLTPGEHYVENCHIHDFSRIDRTYTPAVQLEGVGNRVAHNLFNESPCHAMRVEGNDHLVEYNEVHSVVYESDDQGAVDVWFNPTYRGGIYRYNHWHHIGEGTDQHMQAAIRFDDAISGQVVYGNLFRNTSNGYFGAVQIHGGKDNWIDNNAFLDCKAAVSFSPWGEAGWKRFVESDGVKNAVKEVDATGPLYLARYPELARLAQNCDANRVWRSLVYRCGEFVMRDRGVNELVDNDLSGAVPGFVNEGAGDFSLLPGAPVCQRIGFRAIPFGEMGLYAHPLRASWPVRTELSAHWHGPRS